MDLADNPMSEDEPEHWNARQKAREAVLRRVQLQVEDCELRTPVAAIVEEVLHYEGEVVDALEPVVVLKIDDASATP